MDEQTKRKLSEIEWRLQEFQYSKSKRNDPAVSEVANDRYDFYRSQITKHAVDDIAFLLDTVKKLQEGKSDA